ncbi:MAG: GNAT family N-acetyltransferase [Rickettsiales bacterium]|jgi:predicted GNAT family N-acyltransferase|nr:GNAT family N-acetyltransferase [Rickettsiales bacterium]
MVYNESVSVGVVKFGSLEYWEGLKLRDEILSRPLGISVFQNYFENEWLKYHIGAFYDVDHVREPFVSSKLVGILMLCPEDGGQRIKLRQMCVNVNFRNQGTGRKMVEWAEEYALNSGFSRIFLSARKSVAGFYEKCGYGAVGDEFEEVGIPHIGMEKALLSFQRKLESR